MKTISLDQMSEINGGGFFGGFCFAMGCGALLGVPVCAVVTVGCFVAGAYDTFS